MWKTPLPLRCVIVKFVVNKFVHDQGVFQVLRVPHAREGGHLQRRDEAEAQCRRRQRAGVGLLQQAPYSGMACGFILP